MVYNISKHSTTGHTPFILVHRRQVRLQPDNALKVEETYAANPTFEETPRYHLREARQVADSRIDKVTEAWQHRYKKDHSATKKIFK